MKLYPYLSFEGNAFEALALYARALNGKVNEIHFYSENPELCKTMPENWHTKLMHGNMVASDITIMASDILLGENGTCGNQSISYPMSPISLSINFDSIEKMESTFGILSEDANITMPLQDTFWGARFGMLDDKFGVKWMFNYDYPKD